MAEFQRQQFDQLKHVRKHWLREKFIAYGTPVPAGMRQVETLKALTVHVDKTKRPLHYKTWAGNYLVFATAEPVLELADQMTAFVQLCFETERELWHEIAETRATDVDSFDIEARFQATFDTISEELQDDNA